MSINSILTGPALTKLASSPKTQRIISDLGNESKLLSILLLEGSVIAGRSYHAQKRGGFYEFKETLLENVLACIIWAGGVRVLNKAADLFFKHAFNIDTKIDWKQVANFAKGRLDPGKFKGSTFAAKAAKLLFSVGGSIYTVGVLLPRYKQKVTLRDIEKREKANKAAKTAATGISHQGNTQNNTASPQQSNGIALPRNITAADLAKLAQAPMSGGVRFGGGHEAKNNKNINFTGAFDVISRIGYALENEAIPQLAVVDTGITGGRIINSRNKDEAIEILFRDIASCMFYYFAVPFLSHRFANAFDAKLGVNTLIDPKSLNMISDEFKNSITALAKAKNAPIGIDDIQKALLGTNNETISRILKESLISNKGKLTPDQIQKVVNSVDDILPKLVQETANVPKERILKDLQSYLKAVGPRAINIAKMQADVTTSGNIRALANYLDDIVKGPASKNTVVERIAKEVGKFADDIYAQTQSGKMLEKASLDKLQKLVDSLKASNIDDVLVKDAVKLMETIKTSSGAAGYITKETLEEVLKGGAARNSRFMSEVLAHINGAVKNPLQFVKPGEKVEMSKAAQKYAQRIIEDLQKSGAIKQGEKVDMKKLGEIVEHSLKKTKNKNMLIKTGYLLSAMVIAVVFLSWVIPKTQYLITKIRTGKDSFPGVAGLIDEEGKTNAKESTTTKPAQNAPQQTQQVAHAPQAPVVSQPVQQNNLYSSQSDAFNYFLKQRMANNV